MNCLNSLRDPLRRSAPASPRAGRPPARRTLAGGALGASLFAAVVLAQTSALLGCTSKGADSPAIDLGAPGTSWAAKNNEQRFGFMAAQVHPTMRKVFTDYDANYANFQCTNCHGTNAEQIDYAMPNTGLYSLPKERPYDDAIDYNPQIAVFMMTKVAPTLQQLFNKGEGPPTKVTCFTCHPTSS